ncbi:uncharacterized protein I206_106173 [Kwoniella pini CBS 10737]|uniref:SCA7 domain-containing protein n=1 Tax=Kwoniella pini CBS 10737 TaxID=1296096 RepID=A0A1B9I199_9TREE|nr:uncharacterized protein I206_04998 [Kwoniella pini CBS 10737]OCF49307.1 hypothetical protein I206_04998 [Kwoniella pini CBS 10737]
MPLQLKARDPLPPFTFALQSPSPPADLGLPINQNEPIPPIPPASFIPEKDMYMFGTYPLRSEGEVGRGIIRCLKCKKTGMEWAAGEHKRICNHILEGTPLTTKKVNTKTGSTKTTEVSKKRRASEVSNPTLSPKKRSKLSAFPLNGSSTFASSNKDTLLEKDDEEDDVLSSKGFLKKNEMKKMQKEKQRLERKEAKEKEKMEVAERKRKRATEPINLDKQCGVINDKSLPCARSLTCKTHTVGAKRAVQGRTRPYDELYLEWMRENNPNFKEPQKRETKDSSLNNKDKLKKKKKIINKYRGIGGAEEGLEDDEDGLRELEELIGLTKMSGEKCKNGFYNLGIGLINSTPNREKSNPLEDISRPSLSNNRKSSLINNTSLSNSIVTIPFQTIWKSSSTEFASVGQMLTKALAARSNKHSLPHNHGHKVTIPINGGKNTTNQLSIDGLGVTA